MKVELGKKAKDTVTGFEGTVTALCSYITGEDQILISPIVIPGTPVSEPQWFGEGRVIEV